MVIRYEGCFYLLFLLQVVGCELLAVSEVVELLVA